VALRISKASAHSAVTAAASASTSTTGPSSSTMSTAPAPGGYPQDTAASAAPIASASMISAAAGRSPAATIALTAAPACSMVWNAARIVHTASGERSSRTQILVAMPSVPSEPTNTPVRSYPGACAARPAPSRTSSPSAVHTSRPVTWCTVKPYLTQCAPPEFSATFPPMEQICWLDGSGA
jgi:hypothetical protein